MFHNHKISPIELAAELQKGERHVLPPGWENSQGALEAHRLLAREFIAGIDPYPTNRFQGRGIVICAGGHRLFTNAWVCVRMLRKVGCRLPVQFWYLGDCEMDEVMRGLVAPFGVDSVDAEQLTHVFPARILNGWELKPYAMLHCPFEEVLLLDADNVVMYDPEDLFCTEPYREHGAIFWPDYSRLDRSRLAWKACEVEYRDEPEFESGQIVIDKKRCWEALNLTMHYNEHSDFYYRHVHGDKETFHLALRRLHKSYAMPAKGIHSLDATMCQHDFEGRRVFQHRNMDKWRLDGSNRAIAGFVGEDLCRSFLAELRQAWCGKVHWNEAPNYLERLFIEHLGGRTFAYVRVGHDRRELELKSARTIGAGAAEQERTWTVKAEGASPALMIFGHERPTCRLMPNNGAWEGRWFRNERMVVRLEPRG